MLQLLHKNYENERGGVKYDYLERSLVFPPSVSSLQELWQRFAALAVLSPFPGQILQTSCSHYIVEILVLAEQVEVMLGPRGSSCTTESLQQSSPHYTLIPGTLIYVMNSFLERAS